MLPHLMNNVTSFKENITSFMEVGCFSATISKHLVTTVATSNVPAPTRILVLHTLWENSIQI